MPHLLQFTYALSFLILSVASKKLPPYITQCRQYDPEISGCFRRAIGQIQGHLSGGIPEFRLPSMNPLILPKVEMESGKQFKALFHNITVYNADRFVINDLDVNMTKNQIWTIVQFPHLHIDMQYHIKGKMLILYLDGAGKSTGNYSNVVLRMKANGHRYLRHNREYIKIADIEMDLDLGTVQMHFDNLFRDNPELNAQTNKILNENALEIYNEVKPTVNSIVTQFIYSWLDNIFSKYSVNELFLK